MKISPFSMIGGAVALVTTTLLISTAPQAAADPATAPHQAMKGADDRFPVSVETLNARRTEMFAQIDANGDGLISVEEFAAHEPPMHKGMRSGKQRRMQADHPRPTADQLAIMEDALFERLDSNTDGVLSRDEFSRQAMMLARLETMKSQRFAHADQDGDGYLSPDEFPPNRAAEMDADGDGEITRSEFRAGHQRSAG